MRFTLALVVASLVTLASCSFRDPYPFKNLPKGEAAVYGNRELLSVFETFCIGVGRLL